jgi:hypothetical protein
MFHARRPGSAPRPRSIAVLFALFALALAWPAPSWADPAQPFDPATVPASFDYAQDSGWAALPGNTRAFPVDVFYVHPTTYDGDDNWNASLEWEQGDAKIAGCLLSQAGVFRTCADLVAPYYRQANIAVLRSAEDSPNRQALDVACADVEAAFDAYLARYNHGRPFILAGHSQGSEHLLSLMERRFADPALREKLVAAYLVGWSVTSDDLAAYPHLKVAATPDETGAIITYNTQGENPAYSIVREGAVAVNPLTMTITDEPVSADRNLGAVFFTENGVQEILHYTGGQTVNGGFVIPEPSNLQDLDAMKIPGFYHPYDYTFVFRNLQANAALRVGAYLAKHPSGSGGCSLAGGGSLAFLACLPALFLSFRR